MSLSGHDDTKAEQLSWLQNSIAVIDGKQDGKR